NQDVAFLRKGIEDLSFRVESGFRKVYRIVEASGLSSDFVTETQLGQTVLEEETEIAFPLNLTESTKGRAPGKFSDVLDRDASEKEIQDYFMSECSVLENYGPIKGKLKLTVEDTRQSPVLGTRKPNFVFIRKNTNVDYLNIMAIGEVKKRTGENFNSAQIGQTISFREKLLQLQPRRSSVLVLLTNCVNISIYKVIRVDSHRQTQYRYEFVPSVPLMYNSTINENGWKYLVIIMESSPQDLGWVEPSLNFGNDTVKLIRSISVGRTSIVYEGKLNESESVAVKMAKKRDYLSYFETEIKVLENLSTLDSPHIPKILCYNDNALVMTPIGVRVNNLRREDIRNIITTLRDGYSIDDESTVSFAGALECMPDNILQSLIDDEAITNGPQVDLICFMRSFYLMLYRPSLERVPFKKSDDIKQRAQILLDFWNDSKQSVVWAQIYNSVDELDYNQLIQDLESLF
ncbi:16354_t:CDS:2, partial [Funneliformis caledonium]